MNMPGVVSTRGSGCGSDRVFLIDGTVVLQVSDKGLNPGIIESRI